MILRCPHCKSVHLLTGEPESDVCTIASCRGIMERLTERDEVNKALAEVTCMEE